MTCIVTLYTSGHTLTGASYDAYQAGRSDWAKRIAGSLPFEVGGQYHRADGVMVTCTELSGECALFDDSWTEEHGGELVKLGYRYNRDQDRGRRTAGRYDDYRTVIPAMPETAHSA